MVKITLKCFRCKKTFEYEPFRVPVAKVKGETETIVLQCPNEKCKEKNSFKIPKEALQSLYSKDMEEMLIEGEEV